MSQENVEIVRRAFEAFSRGDVDGAVENVDPDVALRPPETRDTVEGGARHGRDAVFRFSPITGMRAASTSKSWSRSTRVIGS